MVIRVVREISLRASNRLEVAPLSVTMYEFGVK
jgi:hypothetical protein